MCAPLLPPLLALLPLRDGAPPIDAGIAMPDWMEAMELGVVAEAIEGEKEAEAGVDVAAKEEAAESEAAEGDRRA